MLLTLKVGFYKALVRGLKLAQGIISIPSPMLFAGQDASLQLCDAIVQRGYKELLLVTDEMLMKLKLADKMIKRLQGQGVSVTIYSGVLPDPTTEQVVEGSRLAEVNNCDCVMAFGGGSPIDAAKAIAASVACQKTANQMAGLLKVTRTPLPLFAVPTTAGTGSEVSIGAVISDTQTHKKQIIIDPKLVPQMAALDGNVMLGLPSKVTAATGMDALTHAIEAYISTIATSESDELALMAARLIFENLDQAVFHGEDFNARQTMSMASYYAGAAFTKAGLGYVHAISHNVGAAYGIPHGVGNAMTLPRILDYSLESIDGRLANMARVCGAASTGMSDTEAAQDFIKKIKGMITRFKLPYYLDDLKQEDIPHLARAALKEAHFTPYAVPKYLNQAQCETLIQGMMAP